MEKEYLPDAAGFLSKKRRNRRWQKVFGALAAVVVFCTTYALILPAITEEHTLICGLEEHTHTDACYQETRRLVCELEETEGHTHGEACYQEEPVLACGLEETEGHVHTDDCYTEQPVLLCGQEESEEHSHTDECWGTEQVLICGLEEQEPHTHTEECYVMQSKLVCEQEEEAPHVHTEACYETVTELICEQEEHIHTDECYAPVEDEPESDPTADVEARADWEATLQGVTLTGEWPRDLLAVAETQLGYTESSRNFEINQNGKLKGYTRYGAWYGDPYGDWCAMFASFCLHYAEVGDFPLEANCQRWIETLKQEPYDLYREAHPAEPEEDWIPSPGELIFFDWESGETADHVGIVAEYIPASEEAPAQVKTLEGNAGDRVQYQTYEASDSRILGYAELPEQTFYCGIPGHAHGTACYDAAGELVCGFEEHLHTEECELPPPEEPAPTEQAPTEQALAELTFDGPDYTIRVQYGPEAELPEGVTLTAGEIPAGSEDYQRYYDQSLAAMGGDGSEETVLLARFFDVRFELDGETVEPAAPVSVTITYAEPVETGGDVNCQAVHFGENGPELLDVETAATEEGGTSFTHTQDGFSVTGDVVTLAEPPEGSTSHSVTFKVMIDGQWQTVGSSSYYTVDSAQRVYITSDLAAQFFGDYGYTATTDPGYHFGYSYNDIYKIYYAGNTGYCMDISGNKIENNTAVQLWTSNNSTAQIFRIWDAGDSYKYITPVENSAYHVNVLGGGTTDGTKLGIHTATDAASHWKVVSNGDGTTSFFNRNAPDSTVIDFPSGKVTAGNQLQIWNNGGNRYWKLVQQYRISNNIVSAQNADSTWNIGLTPESNGDIVCYYMPAETGAAYTNAAESAISTDNTLWSVKVRDDTHAVYTDDELSSLTQAVASGGEATVTVKNANGILWSCVGATDVTTTQSGGSTTFVIRNVTEPVEVVATKADPEFTVQYYANIDRYVLGDSGNLDLINTSGKKLPTNSGTQSLLRLTLEDTGTPSGQNAGNNTTLHRVKTEKQLTQMYTDGTFNYQTYPGLAYFDKLWGKPNYILDAVLVLKDGKSPNSTNDDDWWWYKINRTTWSNITFTNLASEENAPRQEGVQQNADGTYCILLEEGTVLRLRYETGTQSYDNQANFYDYDITSGQNSNGTWKSGITGINKSDNYPGGYSNSNVANVFAFGNANCETGLGLAQWAGNNINAYNGQYFDMSDGSKPHYGNDVYKGCTFGLVTGLRNGTLIWNSSILVPHLFNDGDANGKHTYNGGSLQFTQTGDTYTLKSANSTAGSRNNLEYFFHPSPSTSTTHNHIFTNNFWPMDSATNKTDPLMGAINSSGTCDVKVNGFWDAQNKVGGAHNGVRVPISDDGRAHNWFFGMNFALTFTLTEDYTGPLEYIFFGDDDLWVFLDDTLICDIGGVHSSVGEYVNLRDYLPNGSSGQHTLSFFYTERGASGSTCWMSFTLPSVTSASTGQDTGSLQIAKSLAYSGDKDFSGEEYQFKVELLTKENGTPLNRLYSYSCSNDTYGIIRSGDTVTLKAGETLTINGLPTGTYYRVEELSRDGYYVTVNNAEGYIASGTIATGEIKPASFVNTPYYELPETGGGGTLWFTLGGTALILAAVGMYQYKKRRREVA